MGALGSALGTMRNNVHGAAVISAESHAITVRVISPAEDPLIANHVVRLLVE